MIVSDLHLEFEYQELDTLDADILVIAGDLAPYAKLDLLDKFFSTIKIPVVYVPGNHEYYGGGIYDRYAHSGVFVLDNTFVELDGLKFAGSTMWTNPSYNTTRQINDMWQIIGLDTIEEYKDTMAFFESDFEADVIVTHFPPTMDSIARKYLGNTLNDYFTHNRPDLVGIHNEKLWIHGHTHNTSILELNGVDIVCNPKGYYNENPAYNRGYIYEY